MVTRNTDWRELDGHTAKGTSGHSLKRDLTERTLHALDPNILPLRQSTVSGRNPARPPRPQNRRVTQRENAPHVPTLLEAVP